MITSAGYSRSCVIDVEHMQSPVIVNKCEPQWAVLCSTRTEQPTPHYYMMPSNTAEVANTVATKWHCRQSNGATCQAMSTCTINWLRPRENGEWYLAWALDCSGGHCQHVMLLRSMDKRSIRTRLNRHQGNPDPGQHRTRLNQA